MIYSSIDLGTNTIRLLIAEKLNGCKFKFLHQESKIARIGEGFGKEKIIGEAALQRTKKILCDYKKKIDEFNVKNIFTVATSAVREAKNSNWFLDNLKSFNLDIKVISPEKEALLTHAGIVYSIHDILDSKNWVAFDLGGGSTEFMFSKGNKLLDSFSIPLGAVKLLEMYANNDPPKSNELKKAADIFINNLKKHPINNKKTMDFIVGNAGTVTSLAAIDLKLDRYSFEKTEKYTLKKSNIEKILHELLKYTKDKRLERYKILEKGREDVIVVGAEIVKSILTFFGKDYLITTNGSLREGLLIKGACNEQ